MVTFNNTKFVSIRRPYLKVFSIVWKTNPYSEILSVNRAWYKKDTEVQSCKHCPVINFERHLINADLSASGSHSWESLTKTKRRTLLKQRFMIGSNKRKESHKTSLFRVEFRKNLNCFTRFFLNYTWISKRCSITSAKKCLARCVPRYLPIQNTCHAYTVSVWAAWNNCIGRVMATRSNARNVKPLAE